MLFKGLGRRANPVDLASKLAVLWLVQELPGEKCWSFKDFVNSQAENARIPGIVVNDQGENAGVSRIFVESQAEMSCIALHDPVSVTLCVPAQVAKARASNKLVHSLDTLLY